ncbi:MAG: type IV pilus modification protein PilV [Cocleimonas sp.]|nr:type IV pilus modification protein PilV [Cocleimonas sp.]
MRSSQIGFSLIESMIATLVISVGLLGVASLQMIAMKGSTHAVQQGHASDLMGALLERMRSNTDGVYADDYNIANSSSYNCTIPLIKNCEDGVTSCSSQELAISDLHYTICGYDSTHLGGVIGSLSSGSISISCIGGPGNCVTGINFRIRWKERILGQEGGGAKELPREISLNTAIVP